MSITAGESWLEEFLECCCQVVERVKKFTRLRLQVGVICSSLFFCSCFLEVWLINVEQKAASCGTGVWM